MVATCEKYFSYTATIELPVGGESERGGRSRSEGHEGSVGASSPQSPFSYS